MANKYYTVELTEKQYNHIHDALKFYENYLNALQIHNATVRALDKHEVSSRRQMLSYLLK